MNLSSKRDAIKLSTEPVGVSAGNANTALPYEQFGIIPGVAQMAQEKVYANPHLNPQPVFSENDHAAAHWFTTRVHLSPLGHAHGKFRNDGKDKPDRNGGRGITTNV
jgi:hypothetical protein